MKIILYPKQESWPAICTRPVFSLANLYSVVRPILASVAQEGDAALRSYTKRFDGVELDTFQASTEELTAQARRVSPELQAAIRLAARNIRMFHEAQREQPLEIETMPGLRCWRQSVAIDRVGLYIPGGTAPLFSSLLMLAIPAQLAGCKEIVVCTPPTAQGEAPEALAFVATTLGLTQVFKIGGAQAVAALASGTESIPQVDKIFGPGNQYVAAAKQLVAAEYSVAIDLPAGPTELLIIADATARPEYLAADLLSQAEHGEDSQVVLVSLSEALVAEVEEALEQQLALLPRAATARRALEHSSIVVLPTIDEAIAFSNCYAPEHLVLAIDGAESDAYLSQIRNAGSVFLGHHTPESLGDYASGTNHTLPTNGAARSYSGVSLDSFFKKITFQCATPGALTKIGPSVIAMAEAEGLAGHAQAVRVRMDSSAVHK